MGVCVAVRMRRFVTFRRPVGAAVLGIAGNEPAGPPIGAAPPIRLSIISVIVKQVICVEIVTVRDGLLRERAVFVEPDAALHSQAVDGGADVDGLRPLFSVCLFQNVNIFIYL